ncbi:cell division protein kinase [Aspergillus heteromorphus CBS 117.55]|uniref:cyclin-dependent kinase n=1 Tax=Aspergillus heteromorphus CBS 117.55 TaxID=1448321 RepID=A0A317VXB3_9EURO|nr:cell division protein kinase [Aspergillus heteromorphus CBS 117.55]PWY77548.1 cell division protein kinase [Aspergillus heteromorphus CBS 117.55]
MAIPGWKISIGFTDRLTAIQSLTTAYQRASSSAAFSEAQSQARKFESEAFDQATSKEQYDTLCQEAIDAAEIAGSTAPIMDSLDQPSANSNPEHWDGGEAIGPYRSCVPHFDGIHSMIYKSRHADGSLVAVKVTVPHLMTPPHDAKREALLLREAASPHVVSLRETLSLDGGRFVLVFPFMRYDFEQLLRRDALTATQTKSHLRDMFSALAYVHKLGLVHRDIKPSNILLDSPEGPAYLADFGIAWKEGSMGSEPADEKIIDVGTTCYRPPEILFGSKGYGAALDLWAAGCVMAEAVTVGHKQLFDSGPLGSDLSLIQSIFQTLGTPDEETWPETQSLPDWGKFQFYEYPPKPWDDVLKGASTKSRDLVSKLVVYESSQRLSAEEALKHPYFSAF